MVPLELAAWHAGIGEMVIDSEARSNPNLFTVGIELANHGCLHRDEDGRFWWELGRKLQRYRRAQPKASTLIYDNGVEVHGWWEPYPDEQIAVL
jgi:N-acetyl-anhydromuramyl-L-alanine amidase AmpD